MYAQAVDSECVTRETTWSHADKSWRPSPIWNETIIPHAFESDRLSKRAIVRRSSPTGYARVKVPPSDPNIHRDESAHDANSVQSPHVSTRDLRAGQDTPLIPTQCLWTLPKTKAPKQTLTETHTTEAHGKAYHDA